MGTQTKKERFSSVHFSSRTESVGRFLIPPKFFLTITFLVVVFARVFVIVVFGTVLWHPGHFVLFFQAASGVCEPGGDLNYEFYQKSHDNFRLRVSVIQFN